MISSDFQGTLIQVNCPILQLGKLRQGDCKTLPKGSVDKGIILAVWLAPEPKVLTTLHHCRP